MATNYTASTTTSKKTETIHIVLSNGNVKEFGIEPEPPVDPDRIPVTDAHRRGVYDPMTGSMLRVPGTADPLGPEACHTGAPIFDGRMRYDLKLDFKRMETVKAEKGYRGPVVVCAVYFTPVAGYIPDRPVIKYLAAQRNIEIAFAPIAGTRILVPFWMKIPTPLGQAMLEATQFIVTQRRRRGSRRRIERERLYSRSCPRSLPTGRRWSERSTRSSRSVTCVTHSRSQGGTGRRWRDSLESC